MILRLKNKPQVLSISSFKAVATLCLIALILPLSGYTQSPKRAFKKATKKNTASAYTQFIKKYPSSKFAQKAKLYRTALDSIEIVIGTYLGNEKRNYYGNKAPNKLDTIWKIYLGEGISPAYGKDKLWKGAGWTGQPLAVREKGKNILIQGAFDYNLKKIDAETGKIIWQTKFDDILKGTGSIWVNHNAENIENRYIIIQGSRKGRYAKPNDKHVTSLRAVSYTSGKLLWKLNVKKTDSYSRDVDGSALVIKDTAYLALENGIFTVFSPDPKKQELLDGMMQPKVYKEHIYYNKKDIALHGGDLVAESSPALLGNRVFTPSGSGHVYGYNTLTGKTDFDFYTGTDLNGSPAVTNDSCLIVTVEKQYMPGPGGVFKLNPAKGDGKACVEWFYPVPSEKWIHWEGGIIGSAAINDAYVDKNTAKITVFSDITGHLHIVRHDKIAEGKMAIGPDGKTKYPVPQVLFIEETVPAISSPIIVGNKIIVATDRGLFLYEIDLKNNTLKRLDKTHSLELDATPIAFDGKIYIACRNGFMYCFGQK